MFVTQLRGATAPLFCLATFALASAASAQTFTILDSPVPDPLFGRALAVEGDIVAVGGTYGYPPSGQDGLVHLFERDGAGVWTPYQTITDLRTNFAFDVRLDAERLLIASPGFSNGDGGLAVYEPDPQGLWVETQFIADDVDLYGGWFSNVMDLDGDWLVVEAGHSLHFFESTQGGWVWRQELAMPPAVGQRHVDMDGDRVVLARAGFGTPTGHVDFIEFDGSAWTVQHTISEGGYFARSLAFDGERVVVGASGSEIAHVYRWEAGSNPTPEADLATPFLEDLKYGRSVAVNGDCVYVGAPNDPESPGYVVRWTSSSAGWSHEVISPGPGTSPSYPDALASDGALTLVGVPDVAAAGSGEVHVLDDSLGDEVCYSNPSSLGTDASLDVWGSTDLQDEQLYLRARPVPDQPGLFFYGPVLAPQPFGDGTLCIAPGSTGYARLPLVSASDGALEHQVDLTDPPSLATRITAGSTWIFQAWFRDPAAGGAGFNLSHAVEVDFP